MLLWLVFAVLTAIVAAALLRPLWRDGLDGPAADRSAHEAELYKHQLAEVDGDVERGLVGAEEAEAARAEIARRLLRTARTDGASAPHGERSKRSIATFAFTAVIACVPVTALALYLAFGSPFLPDQPLQARLEAPAESDGIAGLIAKVEARLREHPEDGEGWDVIAPVYLRQQRYSDAADAFARARRLLGDNAARLAGHGEALVMANNGIVTDEAKKAFDKALESQPMLLKPRFWLAMAAEQDGRFEDAAVRWSAMLKDGAPDASWRPVVQERLRVAEAHANGAAVSAERNAQAPSNERGPTAQDVAAAQSMSAEERAAMINQMVVGLADRLSKDGSDLQGWLKLARAYMVLGRRDDAAKALVNARRNFEGNAQAMAQIDAAATSLGL